MNKSYDAYVKSNEKAKVNSTEGKVGHVNNGSSKIKQQVSHSIKLNRKNKKLKALEMQKRVNRIALVLAMGCILSFVISFCFIFPDLWKKGLSNISSFISSVHMGVYPNVLAKEDGGGKKTPKNEVGKQEKSSPGKKLDKNKTSDQKNVEVDGKLNHLKNLERRRKELDHREKELENLEAELHKQKEEIEVRIKKLQQIRSKIETVLKTRVEVDEKRVAKLVDFYSNMKASKAAEILSDLDEDLAVEIFGRMKKKNAANIMNLLKPEKARVLSEKYAGYRRK